MLITVAQEQLIKVPGFPQIYTDLVILSHTNQTEFDKFKSNKENEALHDRMYPIYVPYNLRFDDEVRIYKKMIASSQFSPIDIAPYSLEVAAMFAVLTRLTESALCPDLIKKMRYYNGEAYLPMKIRHNHFLKTISKIPLHFVLRKNSRIKSPVNPLSRMKN